MSPSFQRVPQADLGNLQRAMSAMGELELYLAQSGLERSLIELMKTRVSQLNGCAYCIDMHTKDARARGVSEQRLYLLCAWQESPYYSERERAALLWTEALTLTAAEHDFGGTPAHPEGHRAEPYPNLNPQGASYETNHPDCVPVGRIATATGRRRHPDEVDYRVRGWCLRRHRPR